MTTSLSRVMQRSISLVVILSLLIPSPAYSGRLDNRLQEAIAKPGEDESFDSPRFPPVLLKSPKKFNEILSHYKGTPRIAPDTPLGISFGWVLIQMALRNTSEEILSELAKELGINDTDFLELYQRAYEAKVNADVLMSDANPPNPVLLQQELAEFNLSSIILKKQEVDLFVVCMTAIAILVYRFPGKKVALLSKGLGIHPEAFYSQLGVSSRFMEMIYSTPLPTSLGFERAEGIVSVDLIEKKKPKEVKAAKKRIRQAMPAVPKASSVKDEEEARSKDILNLVKTQAERLETRMSSVNSANGEEMKTFLSSLEEKLKEMNDSLKLVTNESKSRLIADNRRAAENILKELSAKKNGLARAVQTLDQLPASKLTQPATTAVNIKKTPDPVAESARQAKNKLLAQLKTIDRNDPDAMEKLIQQLQKQSDVYQDLISAKPGLASELNPITRELSQAAEDLASEKDGMIKKRENRAEEERGSSVLQKLPSQLDALEAKLDKAETLDTSSAQKSVRDVRFGLDQVKRSFAEMPKPFADPKLEEERASVEEGIKVLDAQMASVEKKIHERSVQQDLVRSKDEKNKAMAEAEEFGTSQRMATQARELEREIVVRFSKKEARPSEDDMLKLIGLLNNYALQLEKKATSMTNTTGSMRIEENRKEILGIVSSLNKQKETLTQTLEAEKKQLIAESQAQTLLEKVNNDFSQWGNRLAAVKQNSNEDLRSFIADKIQLRSAYAREFAVFPFGEKEWISYSETKGAIQDILKEYDNSVAELEQEMAVREMREKEALEILTALIEEAGKFRASFDQKLGSIDGQSPDDLKELVQSTAADFQKLLAKKASAPSLPSMQPSLEKVFAAINTQRQEVVERQQQILLREAEKSSNELLSETVQETGALKEKISNVPSNDLAAMKKLAATIEKFTREQQQKAQELPQIASNAVEANRKSVLSLTENLLKERDKIEERIRAAQSLAEQELASFERSVSQANLSYEALRSEMSEMLSKYGEEGDTILEKPSREEIGLFDAKAEECEALAKTFEEKAKSVPSGSEKSKASGLGERLLGLAKDLSGRAERMREQKRLLERSLISFEQEERELNAEASAVSLWERLEEEVKRVEGLLMSSEVLTEQSELEERVLEVRESRNRFSQEFQSRDREFVPGKIPDYELKIKVLLSRMEEIAKELDGKVSRFRTQQQERESQEKAAKDHLDRLSAEQARFQQLFDSSSDQDVAFFLKFQEELREKTTLFNEELQTLKDSAGSGQVAISKERSQELLKELEGLDASVAEKIDSLRDFETKRSEEESSAEKFFEKVQDEATRLTGVAQEAVNGDLSEYERALADIRTSRTELDQEFQGLTEEVPSEITAGFKRKSLDALKAVEELEEHLAVNLDEVRGKENKNKEEENFARSLYSRMQDEYTSASRILGTVPFKEVTSFEAAVRGFRESQRQFSEDFQNLTNTGGSAIVSSLEEKIADLLETMSVLDKKLSDELNEQLSTLDRKKEELSRTKALFDSVQSAFNNYKGQLQGLEKGDKNRLDPIQASLQRDTAGFIKEFGSLANVTGAPEVNDLEEKISGVLESLDDLQLRVKARLQELAAGEETQTREIEASRALLQEMRSFIAKYETIAADPRKSIAGVETLQQELESVSKDFQQRFQKLTNVSRSQEIVQTQSEISQAFGTLEEVKTRVLDKINAFREESDRRAEEETRAQKLFDSLQSSVSQYGPISQQATGWTMDRLLSVKEEIAKERKARFQEFNLLTNVSGSALISSLEERLPALLGRMEEMENTIDLKIIELKSQDVLKALEGLVKQYEAVLSESQTDPESWKQIAEQLAVREKEYRSQWQTLQPAGVSSGSSNPLTDEIENKFKELRKLAARVSQKLQSSLDKQRLEKEERSSREMLLGQIKEAVQKFQPLIQSVETAEKSRLQSLAAELNGDRTRFSEAFNALTNASGAPSVIALEDQITTLLEEMARFEQKVAQRMAILDQTEKKRTEEELAAQRLMDNIQAALTRYEQELQPLENWDRAQIGSFKEEISVSKSGFISQFQKLKNTTGSQLIVALEEKLSDAVDPFDEFLRRLARRLESIEQEEMLVKKEESSAQRLMESVQNAMTRFESLITRVDTVSPEEILKEWEGLDREAENFPIALQKLTNASGSANVNSMRENTGVLLKQLSGVRDRANEKLTQLEQKKAEDKKHETAARQLFEDIQLSVNKFAGLLKGLESGQRNRLEPARKNLIAEIAVFQERFEPLERNSATPEVQKIVAQIDAFLQQMQSLVVRMDSRLETLKKEESVRESEERSAQVLLEQVQAAVASCEAFLQLPKLEIEAADQALKKTGQDKAILLKDFRGLVNASGSSKIISMEEEMAVLFETLNGLESRMNQVLESAKEEASRRKQEEAQAQKILNEVQSAIKEGRASLQNIDKISIEDIEAEAAELEKRASLYAEALQKLTNVTDSPLVETVSAKLPSNLAQIKQIIEELKDVSQKQREEQKQSQLQEEAAKSLFERIERTYNEYEFKLQTFGGLGKEQITQLRGELETQRTDLSKELSVLQDTFRSPVIQTFRAKSADLLSRFEGLSGKVSQRVDSLKSEETAAHEVSQDLSVLVRRLSQADMTQQNKENIKALGQEISTSLLQYRQAWQGLKNTGNSSLITEDKEEMTKLLAVLEGLEKKAGERFKSLEDQEARQKAEEQASEQLLAELGKRFSSLEGPLANVLNLGPADLKTVLSQADSLRAEYAQKRQAMSNTSNSAVVQKNGVKIDALIEELIGMAEKIENQIAALEAREARKKEEESAAQVLYERLLTRASELEDRLSSLQKAAEIGPLEGYLRDLGTYLEEVRAGEEGLLNTLDSPQILTIKRSLQDIFPKVEGFKAPVLLRMKELSAIRAKGEEEMQMAEVLLGRTRTKETAFALEISELAEDRMFLKQKSEEILTAAQQIRTDTAALPNTTQLAGIETLKKELEDAAGRILEMTNTLNVKIDTLLKAEEAAVQKDYTDLLGTEKSLGQESETLKANDDVNAKRSLVNKISEFLLALEAKRNAWEIVQDSPVIRQTVIDLGRFSDRYAKMKEEMEEQIESLLAKRAKAAAEQDAAETLSREIAESLLVLEGEAPGLPERKPADLEQLLKTMVTEKTQYVQRFSALTNISGSSEVDNLMERVSGSLEKMEAVGNQVRERLSFFQESKQGAQEWLTALNDFQTAFTAKINALDGNDAAAVEALKKELELTLAGYEKQMVKYQEGDNETLLTEGNLILGDWTERTQSLNARLKYLKRKEVEMASSQEIFSKAQQLFDATQGRWKQVSHSNPFEMEALSKELADAANTLGLDAKRIPNTYRLDEIEKRRSQIVQIQDVLAGELKTLQQEISDLKADEQKVLDSLKQLLLSAERERSRWQSESARWPQEQAVLKSKADEIRAYALHLEEQVQNVANPAENPKIKGFQTDLLGVAAGLNEFADGLRLRSQGLLRQEEEEISRQLYQEMQAEFSRIEQELLDVTGKSSDETEKILNGMGERRSGYEQRFGNLKNTTGSGLVSSIEEKMGALLEGMGRIHEQVRQKWMEVKAEEAKLAEEIGSARAVSEELTTIRQAWEEKSLVSLSEEALTNSEKELAEVLAAYEEKIKNIKNSTASPEIEAFIQSSGTILKQLGSIKTSVQQVMEERAQRKETQSREEAEARELAKAFTEAYHKAEELYSLREDKDIEALNSLLAELDGVHENYDEAVRGAQNLSGSEEVTQVVNVIGGMLNDLKDMSQETLSLIEKKKSFAAAREKEEDLARSVYEELLSADKILAAGLDPGKTGGDVDLKRRISSEIESFCLRLKESRESIVNSTGSKEIDRMTQEMKAVEEKRAAEKAEFETQIKEILEGQARRRAEEQSGSILYSELSEYLNSLETTAAQFQALGLEEMKPALERMTASNEQFQERFEALTNTSGSEDLDRKIEEMSGMLEKTASARQVLGERLTKWQELRQGAQSWLGELKVFKGVAYGKIKQVNMEDPSTLETLKKEIDTEISAYRDRMSAYREGENDAVLNEGEAVLDQIEEAAGSIRGKLESLNGQKEETELSVKVLGDCRSLYDLVQTKLQQVDHGKIDDLESLHEEVLAAGEDLNLRAERLENTYQLEEIEGRRTLIGQLVENLSEKAEALGHEVLFLRDKEAQDRSLAESLLEELDRYCEEQKKEIKAPLSNEGVLRAKDKDLEGALGSFSDRVKGLPNTVASAGVEDLRKKLEDRIELLVSLKDQVSENYHALVRDREEKAAVALREKLNLEAGELEASASEAESKTSEEISAVLDQVKAQLAMSMAEYKKLENTRDLPAVASEKQKIEMILGEIGRIEQQLSLQFDGVKAEEKRVREEALSALETIKQSREKVEMRMGELSSENSGQYNALIDEMEKDLLEMKKFLDRMTREYVQDVRTEAKLILAGMEKDLEKMKEKQSFLLKERAREEQAAKILTGLEEMWKSLEPLAREAEQSSQPQAVEQALAQLKTTLSQTNDDLKPLREEVTSTALKNSFLRIQTLKEKFAEAGALLEKRKGVLETLRQQEFSAVQKFLEKVRTESLRLEKEVSAVPDRQDAVLGASKEIEASINALAEESDGLQNTTEDAHIIELRKSAFEIIRNLKDLSERLNKKNLALIRSEDERNARQLYEELRAELQRLDPFLAELDGKTAHDLEILRDEIDGKQKIFSEKFTSLKNVTQSALVESLESKISDLMEGLVRIYDQIRTRFDKVKKEEDARASELKAALALKAEALAQMEKFLSFNIETESLEPLEDFLREVETDHSRLESVRLELPNTFALAQIDSLKEETSVLIGKMIDLKRQIKEKILERQSFEEQKKKEEIAAETLYRSLQEEMDRVQNWTAQLDNQGLEGLEVILETISKLKTNYGQGLKNLENTSSSASVTAFISKIGESLDRLTETESLTSKKKEVLVRMETLKKSEESTAQGLTEEMRAFVDRALSSSESILKGKDPEVMEKFRNELQEAFSLLTVRWEGLQDQSGSGTVSSLKEEMRLMIERIQGTDGHIRQEIQRIKDQRTKKEMGETAARTLYDEFSQGMKKIEDLFLELKQGGVDAPDLFVKDLVTVRQRFQDSLKGLQNTTESESVTALTGKMQQMLSRIDVLKEEGERRAEDVKFGFQGALDWLKEIREYREQVRKSMASLSMEDLPSIETLKGQIEQQTASFRDKSKWFREPYNQETLIRGDSLLKSFDNRAKKLDEKMRYLLKKSREEESAQTFLAQSREAYEALIAKLGNVSHSSPSELEALEQEFTGLAEDFEANLAKLANTFEVDTIERKKQIVQQLVGQLKDSAYSIVKEIDTLDLKEKKETALAQETLDYYKTQYVLQGGELEKALPSIPVLAAKIRELAFLTDKLQNDLKSVANTTNSPAVEAVKKDMESIAGKFSELMTSVQAEIDRLTREKEENAAKTLIAQMLAEEERLGALTAVLDGKNSEELEDLQEQVSAKRVLYLEQYKELENTKESFPLKELLAQVVRELEKFSNVGSRISERLDVVRTEEKRVRQEAIALLHEMKLARDGFVSRIESLSSSEDENSLKEFSSEIQTSRTAFAGRLGVLEASYVQDVRAEARLLLQEFKRLQDIQEEKIDLLMKRKAEEGNAFGLLAETRKEWDALNARLEILPRNDPAAHEQLKRELEIFLQEINGRKRALPHTVASTQVDSILQSLESVTQGIQNQIGIVGEELANLREKERNELETARGLLENSQNEWRGMNRQYSVSARGAREMETQARDYEKYLQMLSTRILNLSNTTNDREIEILKEKLWAFQDQVSESAITSYEMSHALLLLETAREEYVSVTSHLEEVSSFSINGVEELLDEVSKDRVSLSQGLQELGNSYKKSEIESLKAEIFRESKKFEELSHVMTVKLDLMKQTASKESQDSAALLTGLEQIKADAIQMLSKAETTEEKFNIQSSLETRFGDAAKLAEAISNQYENPSVEQNKILIRQALRDLETRIAELKADIAKQEEFENRSLYEYIGSRFGQFKAQGDALTESEKEKTRLFLSDFTEEFRTVQDRSRSLTNYSGNLSAKTDQRKIAELFQEMKLYLDLKKASYERLLKTEQEEIQESVLMSEMAQKVKGDILVSLNSFDRTSIDAFDGLGRKLQEEIQKWNGTVDGLKNTTGNEQIEKNRIAIRQTVSELSESLNKLMVEKDFVRKRLEEEYLSLELLNSARSSMIQLQDEINKKPARNAREADAYLQRTLEFKQDFSQKTSELEDSTQSPVLAGNREKLLAVLKKYESIEQDLVSAKNELDVLEEKETAESGLLLQKAISIRDSLSAEQASLGQEDAEALDQLIEKMAAQTKVLETWGASISNKTESPAVAENGDKLAGILKLMGEKLVLAAQEKDKILARREDHAISQVLLKEVLDSSEQMTASFDKVLTYSESIVPMLSNEVSRWRASISKWDLADKELPNRFQSQGVSEDQNKISLLLQKMLEILGEREQQLSQFKVTRDNELKQAQDLLEQAKEKRETFLQSLAHADGSSENDETEIGKIGSLAEEINAMAKGMANSTRDTLIEETRRAAKSLADELYLLFETRKMKRTVRNRQLEETASLNALDFARQENDRLKQAFRTLQAGASAVQWNGMGEEALRIKEQLIAREKGLTDTSKSLLVEMNRSQMLNIVNEIESLGRKSFDRSRELEEKKIQDLQESVLVFDRAKKIKDGLAGEVLGLDRENTEVFEALQIRLNAQAAEFEKWAAVLPNATASEEVLRNQNGIRELARELRESVKNLGQEKSLLIERRREEETSVKILDRVRAEVDRIKTALVTFNASDKKALESKIQEIKEKIRQLHQESQVISDEALSQKVRENASTIRSLIGELIESNGKLEIIYSGLVKKEDELSAARKMLESVQAVFASRKAQISGLETPTSRDYKQLFKQVQEDSRVMLEQARQLGNTFQDPQVEEARNKIQQTAFELLNLARFVQEEKDKMEKRADEEAYSQDLLKLTLSELDSLRKVAAADVFKELGQLETFLSSIHDRKAIFEERLSNLPNSQSSFTVEKNRKEIEAFLSEISGMETKIQAKISEKKDLEQRETDRSFGILKEIQNRKQNLMDASSKSNHQSVEDLRKILYLADVQLKDMIKLSEGISNASGLQVIDAHRKEIKEIFAEIQSFITKLEDEKDNLSQTQREESLSREILAFTEKESDGFFTKSSDLSFLNLEQLEDLRDEAKMLTQIFYNRVAELPQNPLSQAGKDNLNKIMAVLRDVIARQDKINEKVRFLKKFEAPELMESVRAVERAKRVEKEFMKQLTLINRKDPVVMEALGAVIRNQAGSLKTETKLLSNQAGNTHIESNRREIGRIAESLTKMAEGLGEGSAGETPGENLEAQMREKLLDIKQQMVELRVTLRSLDRKDARALLEALAMLQEKTQGIWEALRQIPNDLSPKLLSDKLTVKTMAQELSDESIQLMLSLIAVRTQAGFSKTGDKQADKQIKKSFDVLKQARKVTEDVYNKLKWQSSADAMELSRVLQSKAREFEDQAKTLSTGSSLAEVGQNVQVIRLIAQDFLQKAKNLQDQSSQDKYETLSQGK